MRMCISFGTFNLNYFIYCILFLIGEIFIFLFIYDNTDENIANKHILIDPTCYFFGYLLNFFPEWIRNRNSKAKNKPITSRLKERDTQSFEYIYNKPDNKYLPIKEVIKIFFISIFLFLTEILRIIQIITKGNNKDKDKDEDEEKEEYEDRFIFIEFLLILLIPHSSEVYYKHQKLSFLIFTLIEIIKIIAFIVYKILNENFNDYLAIFIEIIISIIYAFYYIYIKRLMKYKFISPYKSNFIIGLINFPLIIIIYLIISFTSLGDENNKYYIDNIFNLFKNGVDTINAIKLISLPIAYGIYTSLLNKIIYDFTLYHYYIPLLIENFIFDISKQIGNENKKYFIIFIISSFFIELIMILVFLEIIELNFCGLNKDLKKNIEFRALNETSLEIKDYYDNEDDNERDIKNEEN